MPSTKDERIGPLEKVHTYFSKLVANVIEDAVQRTEGEDKLDRFESA